jgi:small subunit ribosomal protein S15
MYSRKKGKSGSTKPLKKVKPSWVRYSAKEIEQLVIKLHKSGKSTSEIGIILRDTYGVPDVKTITKKKITKILEENKISFKLPEDLTNLIKKDIKLMTHLEVNKKDMPAKRGHQLTESKIRRLVKYYKRVGKLPKDWNYDVKKAKLLVE